LKADINIEIYAIAAGVEGDRGVGRIAHTLQITTETDVLAVPITANILYDFKQCLHDRGAGII
jgi:hypothetical protein